MRRALLTSLFLAACVDPAGAERQFCEARRELCELDAGVADGGTDAGVDAGTDAGVDAGIDAGVDAGCPRSDDFEGSTWDSCFTLFDPVTSNPLPRIENGSLVFDQTGPNLGWSNGNVGSLLSQEMTGNFVAEIRARIIVPDGGRIGAYTAAALLAVDPASPQLNSRLVSVGTLGGFPDGGDEFGVLTEFTENGSSTFRFMSNGSAESYLRLCRLGSSWFAYQRPLDGGWTGFPAFPTDSGTQLPSTVLVGPGAYNVGGSSTPRIEHDYFRFRTDIATIGQCATLPIP